MTKRKKSDLDILYPTGKTVTVAGEEIKILPLPFADTAESARLLFDGFKIVKENIISADKAVFNYDEDGNIKLDDKLIEFIINFISVADELFFELLAIGSGKPVEWLKRREFNIADGIELALAVFEVNQDFFNNRLSQMMAKLTQVLIDKALTVPKAQPNKIKKTGVL